MFSFFFSREFSQREMMNVAVCILSPMFESSKCYENNLEFIKQKQIPIIAIRILPNWKPFGWLRMLNLLFFIFEFLFEF